MISIVIPVYNVEKYIVKCLESIENQDYKDYEVILVDDGSEDDSVKVINEFYDNKETKWKLIRKINEGQSIARNIGIKQSQGEYIVFIDSDDVISKEFLSSLISNINEKYDFSFCNYEFVNEQIVPISGSGGIIEFSRHELIQTFLKRTVNFVITSMMFKKRFLLENDLFFDENIRFSEDQMYMWKCILASEYSIYSTRKMYGYYIREKSIMTGSPYKRIMSGYKVYSEFCDEICKSNENENKYLKMILPRWKLGTLYTAAKLVNFVEFKSLYSSMNARVIFFEIIHIHEITAYILSLVSLMSPRLMFLACRGSK